MSVIHEHRSEDAGSRPGREQPAENGADVELNSSEHTKAQQMGVAAHDHLGVCGDGTLQNPVVTS